MQTMQKLMGVLVLIVLVSLVASSASAQNLAVQFDEYGNGFASSSGTLPFSIALDPISNSSTLMYQLPFRVTPGDLYLIEPNVTPTTYSDLVRFENDPLTGGGVAYFFSDPADETPSPPADVGVPQPNAATINPIFLVEVGTEGNDGLLYNPNPGDPGSSPAGSVPATYNIISDSVPEPSTLVLLSMSAIGLLAFAWRKRK